MNRDVGDIEIEENERVIKEEQVDEQENAMEIERMYSDKRSRRTKR